jgi:hypothetical protein
MAEKESNTDPVAVSKQASVEIAKVRKSLHDLYDQLAASNSTAQEIARNELCRALVQRLELAEQEAVELTDLIILAGK